MGYCVFDVMIQLIKGEKVDDLFYIGFDVCMVEVFGFCEKN